MKQSLVIQYVLVGIAALMLLFVALRPPAVVEEPVALEFTTADGNSRTISSAAADAPEAKSRRGRDEGPLKPATNETEYQ